MENEEKVISPLSLGALSAMIGGSKYVSNTKNQRDSIDSAKTKANKRFNTKYNWINYDVATSKKLGDASDLLSNRLSKDQAKAVRSVMNRAGLESPKHLLTSKARSNAAYAINSQANYIDSLIPGDFTKATEKLFKSHKAANAIGRKQRVAGAILGALLGVGGGIGINKLIDRND